MSGLTRRSMGRGECSWCGQRRRRTFSYRTGRLLGGLMGEGRRFCNLECFKAYQ